MTANPSPLPVPFTGRKGQRVPNGTQMVTVYDAQTGEAITVKPISAREGLDRGVWLKEPPVQAAAEPVEAAVEAKPKKAKP